MVSERIQQAVIFDIGRVLGIARGDWLAAIEREYGVPSQIWRPLRDGVETSLSGKPFGTNDMIPVLAERLEPFFGHRSEAAAKRICALHTDPDAMEDIEPVTALLPALHQSGVAVGILSNGPSDTMSGHMGRLLASGCVDAMVLSGADGVGKPSPDAFALILQRLNVDAANAWFVDDVAVNVQAGAALGITSLVFDGDAAKLEAELRATGLRW